MLLKLEIVHYNLKENKMITSVHKYIKAYLPIFMKRSSVFKKCLVNLPILIMLLGIITIMLSPLNAYAQKANKVVTVVGFGSTPNEARNDAVRQALQETMQQLIVVDRAIKDDQIIRDKIMSTMNGYIEDFKELSTKKEGQQIAVKAVVTVSSSRIENFIGTSIGGGGSVSGAALFADTQREIAQRKARGEIFDRLFRGFPSEVMETKLLKISPSPDLKYYIIDIEMSFSKPWVDALKSGLEALSTGRHRRISEMSEGELRFEICEGKSYSPQKFFLPPGEYGLHIEKALHMQGFKSILIPTVLSSLNLLVAMQFIDERGSSVGIKKNCFDFLKHADRLRVKEEPIWGTASGGAGFFFFNFGSRWQVGSWTLNINPVIRHIQIPASEINVAKAKNVALLPYLVDVDNTVVLDIMATEPVADICDEPMDRAVRRLMMK